MKLIIFLIAFLFTSANLLQAQNKTITIYYSGDSTEVVNIANTDSIVVFICGVSKVKYENKVYNTVLIGEQCWLKENLNVGTRIDGSLDQTDNSPNYIEKYCYGNQETNCNIYGGLYQWNEAMKYISTEGAQGICPDGWHIPTLIEFQTCSTTVGGDGDVLKAVGQGSGTDTTGFSALLTGARNEAGFFYALGSFTDFWSSTNYFSPSAYAMELIETSAIIYFWIWNRTYGHNIRCIMD